MNINQKKEIMLGNIDFGHCFKLNNNYYMKAFSESSLFQENQIPVINLKTGEFHLFTKDTIITETVIHAKEE